MGDMHTLQVHIDKKHAFFDYADQVTRLTNNLINAVRFRQRQVMTAVEKDEKDWTKNEREVMDEIKSVIPLMKVPMDMPSKGKTFIGYEKMDMILKLSKNPDYFATGLPRHTAQHAVKMAVRDMKSFFAACKAYREDPNAFTGKPELPGYKKKGGCSTAIISNQQCIIKIKDDKAYAEFPGIKDKPVCIGEPMADARLKQASIVPQNGTFILSFQFETEASSPAPNAAPDRICAIDFGVDNFMAVTNNCGLENIIYKGGVIKSVNQLYNKKTSKIVSEQTLATGKKFVPTDGYYSITNRRNRQMSDIMHKTAKHFITWCVENRIDTVVVGVNKLWKQNVKLGHKNAQEFVEIPFFKFRQMLSYLCQWNGIRYVEQEESYTSKASFLDMDPIPVYKEGVKHKFSGKRKTRGLYVSKDGTVINADLNGSANILRKRYPDAFGEGHILPDFSYTTIIRHPDLDLIKENREKQLKANSTSISKSKEKRQRRKAARAAA